MEVDRPVADAAAAQVRDEGLAEAVQQRPAEQDRDAANRRRARRCRDVARSRRASGRASAHRSPGPWSTSTPCSWSRPRDDLDVADLRHVAQHRRLSPSRAATIALGTRFFAPRTVTLPRQRDAAADGQNTTHVPDSSRLLAPKSLQRLQLSIGYRVTDPKYGRGVPRPLRGPTAGSEGSAAAATAAPRLGERPLAPTGSGGQLAGSVFGLKDGRVASNAVMSSSCCRVSPMSSRPSSRRHRV